MLKSLKSNSYRFVVVLLLLLTFLTNGMVGKVIPVSALADPAPIPELAPVFDTQIYQLKDYVDENIIDTPKEPIFYMLMGAYLVSQAGMNQYELIDPYTTQDGVLGWLKSTGIQLYNSLVDFIPYDPITGTDLKPFTTAFVGYALGAAGLANKYSSESDFLDDVDNSNHFYLPFDQSLQIGINTVLAQNGGLYNWQRSTGPWVTHGFVWNDVSLSDSELVTYVQYLSQLPQPYVKFNSTGGGKRFNGSSTYFSQYHNLFIDTDRNLLLLFDDNGNIYPSSSFSVNAVYYYQQVRLSNSTSLTRLSSISFNPNDYVDLVQLAQAYFDNHFTDTGKEVLFDSFVDTVYYGNLFQERVLLTNETNLNFSEILTTHYLQVQNEYLLDLKGLISSLIGITSLQTEIISNLYDLSGNIVTNLPTISVSIDLPDNNPLPVNLNDIQIYTDNEYLDVVKQRSLQASETIGEYVAFWHNCDAELVYAILGSFIVILIGAFIGKWGHS